MTSSALIRSAALEDISVETISIRRVRSPVLPTFCAWESTSHFHKPPSTKEGYFYPEIAPGAVVLDVGTGLERLPIRDGKWMFCTDVDAEHLSRLEAVETDRRVSFYEMSGSDLKFPDRSFDMVVARLSIPYMHIDAFFREASRVLVPGGRLYITYHDTRSAVFHLRQSFRRGQWKDVIYRSYILANTACLHFWGGEFRFPLNTKRRQSCQTERALGRALKKHGFQGGTFYLEANPAKNCEYRRCALIAHKV